MVCLSGKEAVGDCMNDMRIKLWVSLGEYGCRFCKEAIEELRKIARNKNYVKTFKNGNVLMDAPYIPEDKAIVITPSYNSAGKFTHHHIELVDREAIA